MMTNKDLKRRIIEISYKNKLSHLGSCLTAVDIIKEIYDTKKDNEKFVLSSGHAGLALYVVLEDYFDSLNPEVRREWDNPDAEEIFKHHGVHPDRCGRCGISCSSGSLGQGLPIAVGMALADRSKNVYCLISDGEYAEGSIHEALRIITEQKLINLKVYLNFNGWGAYKRISEIDEFPVYPRFLNIRGTSMVGWPEWLQYQQAHYVVMDENKYREALEILK